MTRRAKGQQSVPTAESSTFSTGIPATHERDYAERDLQDEVATLPEEQRVTSPDSLNQKDEASHKDPQSSSRYFNSGISTPALSLPTSTSKWMYNKF